MPNVQKKISLLLVAALSIGVKPSFAQASFTEESLSHGMEHVSIASDFMGAAVAIFDYNNDGWQDVYLTGGLHHDKLFKNLGNGFFTDATTAAGGFQASVGYKTTSVVTADLNNDGFREIIVGTARNMPMFVYQNNANGTFTHITPTTGVNTIKNTQAIVTGDFDLDGRIDIYVINYVKTPITIFDADGNIVGYNHTCSPNDLYRNLGGLTFADVSATSGADNNGCGLAGLFTDIDGDYKPDLYVANDFGAFTHIPNAFLKNMNPGAFINLSSSSELDASIFGMGIAHGDYDKDGLLDIYVTNLGRNILYHQISPGVFEDVTTAANVEDAKDPNGLNVVGWGTAFIDVDNDSYEDLYVANGYVPAAKTYETSQNSENKVFRNLKNGTFEDVSEASHANDNKMHRGMAVGDMDNDGDEDMVVTKLLSTGVPVQTNVLYYINNQNLNHHWIQVGLKGNGTTTNRDGFGSTVKVHYNHTIGIKGLSGGSSHASQNTSVLHFGLNTTSVIDSVEVFWPGGARTRVLSPPVDTHILIEQNVPGFAIRGCTNPSAANYNLQATQNYGCYFPVPGCTDATASNYNPAANANDGSCDFITAIPEKALSLTAAVYPNPMHSELSINTTSRERTHVELFDIQGRLVLQSEFSGGETTLKPDISAGLYYYRITSNGITIKTGKIIKQ